VAELVQFRLDRKYLDEDDKELIRLLDLPMEKKKFV